MSLVLKIREEKEGLSFAYSQIQTIRACVQLLFYEMLRRNKSEYYTSSEIKRKQAGKYTVIDLRDAKYEGREMEAILDLFYGEDDFVPDYESIPLESTEQYYSFQDELDESLVSVWRGFQAFVDHDDSSGFHSVGDCVDICLMFEYIDSLIPNLKGMIVEDINNVRKMYMRACKSKREVFFC